MALHLLLFSSVRSIPLSPCDKHYFDMWLIFEKSYAIICDQVLMVKKKIYCFICVWHVSHASIMVPLHVPYRWKSLIPPEAISDSAVFGVDFPVVLKYCTLQHSPLSHCSGKKVDEATKKAQSQLGKLERSTKTTSWGKNLYPPFRRA